MTFLPSSSPATRTGHRQEVAPEALTDACASATQATARRPPARGGPTIYGSLARCEASISGVAVSGAYIVGPPLAGGLRAVTCAAVDLRAVACLYVACP